MKKYTSIIILVILFAITLYASFMYNLRGEFDKIFVSLATFLFTIFTGFFISNQTNRYGKIRDTLSQYDGKMSGIYRAAMSYGEEGQRKIGEIISAYYKKIVDSKAWDYHFNNKSTTITDLHKELSAIVNAKEKLSEVEKQSIARITSALMDMQVLRKQLVVLREERIPTFQWFLIMLFGATLIVTVLFIPSQGFFIGSMLKSSLMVSVLSVILILKNFDNLEFFEGRVGAHSAEDVISIIEGKK